jgi:predicted pyridoxine 5'-phosphate oxidase superfamily flavin-nucleotide-binding protein
VTDATFHAGETALQWRGGSRAHLAEIGPRVIRAFMPQQHRDFFAELPFVLAATVDGSGQPWASALAGPPGFVHSPLPGRLRIDALPALHDPIAPLREGAAVGLLGIQPHTRRRNRMNGRVVAADERGFEVQVGQSFGNCPKYIRPREARYVPPAGPAAAPRAVTQLDDAARDLIAGADTFFIASAHPQAARVDAPTAFGIDVSHRGGPPGFVRLSGGNTLVVPDFVGNSFFNTLGNLQLEPRCGLLFVDFERGDLLHVAAQASVEWEGPELDAIDGAQRLLRLEVLQAIAAPAALPLQWRVAG